MTCEGMDEKEEFARIVGAMKVLLFQDDEIQNIWELMACVLHLGNLGFGGEYRYLSVMASYVSYTYRKGRAQLTSRIH